MIGLSIQPVQKVLGHDLNLPMSNQLYHVFESKDKEKAINTQTKTETKYYIQIPREKHGIVNSTIHRILNRSFSSPVF